MAGTNSNMTGKVCLVTGATAGIGRVAAEKLAKANATVVVVGRNDEKCRTVVDEIKTATGNQNVSYMVADLSSRKSIKTLTDQFKQAHARLDVLVNNAGAIYFDRKMSADDIEMTMALNHFGYFWMTIDLLDLLKSSAPSRIVTVSSNAHRRGAFDVSKFPERDAALGYAMYAKSKFANVLFSNELSRLLEGTGVTSNCLHPGVVATGFGAGNGLIGGVIRTFASIFGVSPEEGAKTIVYLATADEVANETGKYFVNEKATTPSKPSTDDAAAKLLWQKSTEITQKIDG